MPTAKKIEEVAQLKDRIGRAEIAIATSYQGTSVAEQVELRAQLREAGAEMRVVKNTLLRIAAADAGLEQFADLADGPTAVVFGYEEPVGPARALTNYLRDHDNSAVAIRKAVIDGVLVDEAYVRDLATVPPREELLSRIAGGLVGKIRELMMLLDGTTREFAGLIEARAVQLEEQGGGAAEEATEATSEAPAASEDTAPEAAEAASEDGGDSDGEAPEASTEDEPEASNDDEPAAEAEAEAASESPSESESEEDNEAS